MANLLNRVVSILIPVYNSAPWLARCLDSIIGQTYTNIEILIYDDGSNDDSSSVYSMFIDRDRRIRVIGVDRVGIAEARNKLVNAAIGYASIFIDSDDWVEPNMIEVLLSYLLSDNLDFCGCSINYCQGVSMRLLYAGPHKYKGYVIYNREHVIKQYLELQPLHGSLCNKLIRTELMKQFSFNKGWSYAEDSSFMWKVVNNVDKVGILNQPLYHYEIHAGGLGDWHFNMRHLVFIQSWEQILRDVFVAYPQFIEIAYASFLHINLSMLYSIMKSEEYSEKIKEQFIDRIRTIKLADSCRYRLGFRMLAFYYLICHSWTLTKYSFKAAKCLHIC